MIRFWDKFSLFKWGSNLFSGKGILSQLDSLTLGMKSPTNQEWSRLCYFQPMIAHATNFLMVCPPSLQWEGEHRPNSNSRGEVSFWKGSLPFHTGPSWTSWFWMILSYPKGRVIHLKMGTQRGYPIQNNYCLPLNQIIFTRVLGASQRAYPLSIGRRNREQLYTFRPINVWLTNKREIEKSELEDKNKFIFMTSSTLH